MAIDTWTAGVSADWNTPSDWSGGVPNSSTVVASLAESTTGSKTTYTVSIAANESFTAGTLDIGNASNTHSVPALSISGTLTLSNLAYTKSKDAVAVTINSGGRLKISSSITDASNLAETIAIDGTGPTGGTLELGSASVDNSNVTYSFNDKTSGLSTGAIQFDGLAVGATTNQHISNVAAGDKFVFSSGFLAATDTVSYSSATGVLTVKTAGLVPVLTMNNVLGSATGFTISGNSLVATVCFARGTLVRTPSGEVAVEQLRAGDEVTTIADGVRTSRPIKWLGHRRIDLLAHPKPEIVAPIRIRRGAFDENMPERDLLISPDHAVFVDGALIAARQLVNGASITQERGWTAVDYYHVELDSHAILLAEGLPAESYLDTGNRGFFANAGLPLTLHPDLTGDRAELSRAAGACAPFVVDEAAVRPVWQRLADRAASLGYSAPALATTTDPALRIVSKGRTIQPIFGRDGLYIFPLPIGATGARIVSRAAAPAAARPWLDDRRELGVPVSRIVLRTAGDVIEIPVDHPDLIEGWWKAERESAGPMHRWTNGNALLALPAATGHCMLELHLRGTMTYPVTEPATCEGWRRAG